MPLADPSREKLREIVAIRAVDPQATAYLMYQLGNVLVIREVSGRRDFPFEKILGGMDDLINHGLAPPAPRGPMGAASRRR